MIDRRPDLEAIAEALEAAVHRKRFRAFSFWKPYRKQLEFFGLGATRRERLLDAGTQLGKSDAGAFETACHLTGEYPAWWPGRRFDRPVKGWMAGETALVVRDVQQKKLCGEPGVEGDLGTGMIPKEAFTDKPSLSRGVTDAYDTIQVRHKSGGISIGRFKSYEQGRTKFQGETLDFCWFDEEADEQIYAEGMARTTATGGMVFTTFTPLKGRSAVVLRFWDEPSPDRGMVVMTIDDVAAEPHGHIKPEERDRIVAGYLPMEREARARGIPMLGSGRVFTAPEETIREPAIARIPIYWRKLWGIDFGIGHPFGAVLGLWDTDNDVIHIHHCIRISDALPLQHWAAMRQIGAEVPIAWPKDGGDREKSTGEPLAAQYKKHGARMLADHATWPEGGVSTAAGITEWDERERTGRIKVSDHLSEWFEERSSYHYKDGQIVKIRDDLMSATRILLMMKRYARPVQLGSMVAARETYDTAQGLDFDLHAV